MFEVGDFVILRDIDLNDNIELEKNRKYKIQHMSYSHIGHNVSDLYLVGFPNQPFYHKRFELDLSYSRMLKINKIKDKICSK